MAKKKGQKRDEKENKKTHSGLHHIIPTSRGGTNDPANIYPYRDWGDLYKRKHPALHTLFANMTPGEIISVISRYTNKDGQLDPELFTRTFSVRERVINDMIYVTIKSKKATKDRITNKKKAWNTLFSGMSAVEAIEWITREFIRKDWVANLSEHCSEDETA